jgi:methyl-accepting chemotaxis protein
MTIQERFDKLTELNQSLAERHAALAQSLELLHLDIIENTKSIGTLSLVIREVSGAVAAANKAVSQMSRSVSQISESISVLGRIAETHEHRLARRLTRAPPRPSAGELRIS